MNTDSFDTNPSDTNMNLNYIFENKMKQLYKIINDTAKNLYSVFNNINSYVYKLVMYNLLDNKVNIKEIVDNIQKKTTLLIIDIIPEELNIDTIINEYENENQILLNSKEMKEYINKSFKDK
jgi:hypothetical protein